MPLIVNKERIPDSALDRELLRLSSGLEADAPHAGGIDPATLRSAALRNVVERTLLIQEANAQSLSVSSDEVQTELERRWQARRSTGCDPAFAESIRQDLLLERVSEHLTRHVPKPSYAEAERFYKANLHLYNRPEAVEAAHILSGFDTPDGEEAARLLIEQAQDELSRGEPFERVADRFSACKGVGGSVGWVTRGQMVQEFEDAVFALRPGQHSGVFRTVFGFHIAITHRRRAAGLIPFAEVKAAIIQQMLAQARRSELQAILRRMQAESDIQFVDGLPNG